MILDVAVFVIVLFARRVTADWHNHRALLDIANLVAALAIAATTFRALPDVILRLTIFVEPGDPIFTSDMLLRALGFALGAAVAIISITPTGFPYPWYLPRNASFSPHQESTGTPANPRKRFVTSLLSTFSPSSRRSRFAWII